MSTSQSLFLIFHLFFRDRNTYITMMKLHTASSNITQPYTYKYIYTRKEMQPCKYRHTVSYSSKITSNRANHWLNGQLTDIHTHERKGPRLKFSTANLQHGRARPLHWNFEEENSRNGITHLKTKIYWLTKNIIINGYDTNHAMTHEHYMVTLWKGVYHIEFSRG